MKSRDSGIPGDDQFKVAGCHEIRAQITKAEPSGQSSGAPQFADNGFRFGS